MRRRNYLSISALGLAALAGCAGEADNSTEEPTDTDEPEEPEPDDEQDGGDTETEEPEQTEEETETEEPEPELTTLSSTLDVDEYYDSGHTSLSGNGQEVTDTFSAGPGLMVAAATHDGDSNFIVELIDDDSGDRADGLFNVIGSFDGVVGVALEQSEYFLDVNADGDWSIDIAEPFAPQDAIHQLPVEASGAGQDVVGPVSLDGRATVSGEHAGESNFIVEIIEESASGFRGTEIVFNEIGEFEGETSVDFQGTAWIDVSADGDWSLGFE